MDTSAKIWNEQKFFKLRLICPIQRGDEAGNFYKLTVHFLIGQRILPFLHKRLKDFLNTRITV